MGRFSCDRSKSTRSWSPASGQRDWSGSIAARTRVLISVTCESRPGGPVGRRAAAALQPVVADHAPLRVQLRLVDGAAGLARGPHDDPLEPADGRRRSRRSEARREVAVGGALGDGHVGGDGGVDLHRRGVSHGSRGGTMRRMAEPQLIPAVHAGDPDARRPRRRRGDGLAVRRVRVRCGCGSGIIAHSSQSATGR